jgi:phosphopantothenate-cysteine ligase
MKWLITSGGTKVPIDPVRDITNMSSGTFGSRIAHEALFQGNDVTFLHAKNSKTPYSCTINSKDMGFEEAVRQLCDIYDRNRFFKETYREVTFRNFADYAEQLENLLRTQQPDITILAAAVSDYGVVNPAETKIRSKDDLLIELKPLPKLIRKVKEWAPNTLLVGFKLLVNSSVDDLLTAAWKSIEENRCDLVVANDLSDIKNNNHILRVVGQYNNGAHSVYEQNQEPDNPYYLARCVVHAAQMKYHIEQRKRETKQ